MAVFIPNKTINKMKKLGLSEAQVIDVFNTGIKTTLSNGIPAIIKKYPGYEIGVMSARGQKSGDDIITHVWKRPRR